MTLRNLKQYAMCFVGRPYKWGGDDPMGGYDCSGFIIELLNAWGVCPRGDHTSQGLYDYYKKEENGFTCLPMLGALVFYGKSVSKITHIGFCISSTHYIEAGGGGSKTNDLQDAIDQNAFIRIRPIKRRSDLVAICFPKY